MYVDFYIENKNLCRNGNQQDQLSEPVIANFVLLDDKLLSFDSTSAIKIDLRICALGLNNQLSYKLI